MRPLMQPWDQSLPTTCKIRLRVFAARDLQAAQRGRTEESLAELAVEIERSR